MRFLDSGGYTKNVGSFFGDLSIGVGALMTYPLVYGLAEIDELCGRSLQGDGSPIIVTPGFMASDFETYPSRKFFEFLGYSTYGWGNGRNVGDINQSIEHCEKLLKKVYETHNRPVTLVGWSLGGIYVRETAKENRSLVKKVVTLGTPFAIPDEFDESKLIVKLFRNFAEIDCTRETEKALLNRFREAPGVPNYSFYTRSDGVIDYKWCIQEGDKLTKNIEVPLSFSHFGFMFNPAVLERVAWELAR